MVSCPQGDIKTRRNKMTILASIVIAVVAVLHVGFLLLEMFFWDHPFGRKRFGMTPEYSQASASLAANQGLYNGFLAAGLIWGLASGQFSVKLFFLVCVIIAGIYGAFTARRSILYIQAMPALLGLILLYLSR
jgi:putative membrane protein